MTLPSSGPLSLNDIQGEFGGTNPIGINEYYAGGGLVPAGTSGTYGAVPTSGQISIQNFYGTSNYIPVYIEDVFSTWLYTGNGTSQTITNGINLAGNGGMVWFKRRNAAEQNNIYDSARGWDAGGELITNTIDAAQDQNSGYFAASATGFSFPTVVYNGSGNTYASWTFRKQPKFFDVVTWSGNGVVGRQIAHNLGSVPGCIIVKRTNLTGGWFVYHRSLGASQSIRLEEPGIASGALIWNSTAPTSTVFTVNGSTAVNASGFNYVAYLFAHDAGGFGLSGTDNVISCGSYVGNSASGGQFINLGYEPQWVLQKNSTGIDNDWHIQDVMRGAPVPGTSGKVLRPNSNIAEYNGTNAYPAATGFYATGDDNNSGDSYIYIAIRRGPMKTPTSGTSVFSPVSAIATGGTARTTGFPVDLQILAQKDKANYIDTWAVDRLRGVSTTNSASGRYVFTNTTDAEATANAVTRDFGNTGYVDPNFFGSLSMIWWNFRRAPGFFDVVCYTGTGSANYSVAHNLAKVPEIVIIKERNRAVAGWRVPLPFLGSLAADLNLTDAAYDAGGAYFGNGSGYVAPTSTQMTLGSNTNVNNSGTTYVAYLFATCPGVSKVGSYTGNGSSQTINCGFTGGARFVMIKRTDSTGNWWVWDTARGMTAGTDYRIPLNTTAAETNANWVYTNASGFQIVTTDATVNASGGTYIYLAIA